jgi:acyl-CoA thioester hydrolase
MKISDNSILAATIDLAIPFFDVDSMGVTWHGNYIKYFELARCGLLKKINYSYTDMMHSGYAWPVVDMRVKYIKPTVFNQEITVTAFLVEYENRLKIEYLIVDKATQQKLTIAYSIQVAVDMKTQEMCFVTPEVFLTKIRHLL